jgi:hypothetical protein
MATWPALKEVRSFLRLQPDDTEDLVIDTARMAAVDYGIRRLNYLYPVDSVDVPDTAHQACVMHSARLYRRRDSIDGTLGFGDLGLVRVGRQDPDIDALYASVGPLVFG